jgi:hypothetical protein
MESPIPDLRPVPMAASPLPSPERFVILGLFNPSAEYATSAPGEIEFSGPPFIQRGKPSVRLADLGDAGNSASSSPYQPLTHLSPSIAALGQSKAANQTDHQTI